MEQIALRHLQIGTIFPSIIRSDVHMEAQRLTQELRVAVDHNMVNRLKKTYPNGPLLEEKEMHQSSSLKRNKSPPKLTERLLRYLWWY